MYAHIVEQCLECTNPRLVVCLDFSTIQYSADRSLKSICVLTQCSVLCVLLGYAGVVLQLQCTYDLLLSV